jgi:hypothetical protein
MVTTILTALNSLILRDSDANEYDVSRQSRSSRARRAS